MSQTERGPGRPRHRPSNASAPSRDQILDAAAALFVEHGVSATSTRMIAERVGIRQASLYYHFAGKDEMLAELLSGSVRPSLEAVAALEARVPNEISPAVALRTLALIDVETLTVSPHNIGTLYLLPEVQSERFDAFRAERASLRETYGRLGTAASIGTGAGTVAAETLGEILIQVVEVIIQIRRHREPTEADAAAIADSCLRLCGLDERALVQARQSAHALAGR